MNIDVVHVDGNVSESVGGRQHGRILTMTDSKVTNSQVNQGTVGSKLNATANHVNGNVSLQASAICNAANISTDPNMTEVKSEQICATGAPSTKLHAQVFDVGGDVSLAAMAVANQLPSIPMPHLSRSTISMKTRAP